MIKKGSTTALHYFRKQIKNNRICYQKLILQKRTLGKSYIDTNLK